MRGLWLSGLRLGKLSVSHGISGGGRDPGGHVRQVRPADDPAESEKGGKDRVYPVTPDFAEFLAGRFPKNSGRGLSQGPAAIAESVRGSIPSRRFLVAVGKTAGVKVDEKAGEPRLGSAHDLRRAFGFRWSRRVNSMIHERMMRHEASQPPNVSTSETGR